MLGSIRVYVWEGGREHDNTQAKHCAACGTYRRHPSGRVAAWAGHRMDVAREAHLPTLAPSPSRLGVGAK